MAEHCMAEHCMAGTEMRVLVDYHAGQCSSHITLKYCKTCILFFQTSDNLNKVSLSSLLLLLLIFCLSVYLTLNSLVG